jgi:hypothetical protein
MKILVFDDNATHRNAAKAQLKDHDVTVVGTYDEAQKLLIPHRDYDKAHKAMAALFPGFKRYESKDEEKNKAYDLAFKEQNELATTYPGFAVVLTDLLVPASSQAMGPDGYEHVGKEMPIGIFIALLAAALGRAKYAAVFSDSSHHDHPGSACFDRFNEGECNPTPFTVGGCKVLLSNTRNWVGFFDPKDLSVKVDPFKDMPSNVSWSQREKEWVDQGKAVRTKDWSTLLQYLLTGKEGE